MPLFCDFSNGVDCPVCGRPKTQGDLRNCTPVQTPLKLGDRVEAVTKALGIPTCGGCQKRKAALNKLSDWWRGEAT